MQFLTVLAVLMSAAVQYVSAQEFIFNDFDSIKYCKQYNTLSGYNDPPKYLPIEKMSNVVDTGTAKYFRFAVLGRNDAVIRIDTTKVLGVNEFTEIVLGGWDNKLTTAQHQRRVLPDRKFWNEKLGEAYTPDLLSQFPPVMMILRVSLEGQVNVFLDGDDMPFLSFFDPELFLNPPRFMAFTKYEKDLIFFYDCPIKDSKVALE